MTQPGIEGSHHDGNTAHLIHFLREHFAADIGSTQYQRLLRMLTESVKLSHEANPEERRSRPHHATPAHLWNRTLVRAQI